MNIRRSVKKCLGDIDQTQAWLASELDTTASQVSRWVNSDNLGSAVVARFADVFNMTASEFIALGE